jgi:hypothetical protein
MRFKLPTIAVAAVAATTVAGVGYAAVPGGDGTIHGCYDNVSGQMRLYDAEDDSPRSCGSKETEVSWNEEGPAGVSGRVVMTGASARDSTYTKSVAVYCPPGKRVIGGGARISGANDYSAAYGAAITASWPHDLHDPSTGGVTGWAAGAQETSGSYTLDWRLHAWAICASVAP